MAVNSGQTRVVINTLERLLSGDLNDLQAYAAAALGESVRRLVMRTVRPIAPGGSAFPVDQEIDPTTLTTPLTATVLGGLLVNPQGSQLLIDAGVMAAVYPGTGGAADSVLALVTADPVNPGLGFTPNVASTRWDLVEASITEDALESSQSRDIYNPATQTFSSLLVPKIRSGRLTYRVRAGVPGGAIPALDSGWLPIAVLFHPGATASYDDVTIYDVRPLVDDRRGTDRTPTWGRQRNHAAWSYIRTTGLFTGRVAIDNAPGGDAGAPLTDGSGARGDGLGMVAHGQVLGGLRNENDAEVTLASHLEAGASLVADAFYGLWLVFPQNLPRWRKLADTPTGGRRWPVGCGGILTVGPGVASPNFGCGGLARLPAGLGDANPHRAVLFGVIRTTSGTVLGSSESNLDGWTTFEAPWEANSISQSIPGAGSVTSVFTLGRLTATSGAALPAFPIEGIKCRYQALTAIGSPGSATQVAPTTFVVDTTAPPVIYGDFPAFGDYTTLPAASFVRSYLTLTRPDSPNNNGLGNRGAPVPWSFSVTVAGCAGIVFDGSPTVATLRFTGLQFRI